MVRIILAVSFFTFTYLLKSQITITSSAMPSPGDTLRYSTASAVGFSFNYKNTGANKSWDFSTLTANGQDVEKFYAANKTPYAFYFFGQIGQKTADSLGAGPIMFKNIYTFSTKNTTVYKTEGLGYSVSGIPLASMYDNEDEVYQFPLNFNDSDVSTFHFKFSIPGQTLFTYVQGGKRTNVVDGWGSIKTPYKTYSDVLRVRTIVDQVDTLISSIAKIPIPRRQVIFKWLSLTEKIPVLEITGTMNAGIFTATQIRYRDKYNGLSNPFKPNANFSVNKTSGFVTVDTFAFTDKSTPFATGFTWQITPSNGVRFVKGTSASSRNPSVVFDQRGKFTVSLTATNIQGSGDTTAVELINIDFGANTKYVASNTLQIFPNPVVSKFTIQGLQGTQKFIIFDPMGRQVMEGIGSNGSQISLQNFPSGMYILSIQGVKFKIWKSE